MRAAQHRLRIAWVLLVLVPVTLALMPLQWLSLRLGWQLAHHLPRVFHGLVAWLLRVRITQLGSPAPNRPLLVISNHQSWLDITVLSTLMPLSFIAKSEVATWPVFGTFARLQRSVFIDRGRRKGAAEANREIAARLADGDAIVLFAEGTTSDGNHVLPFKSAVVGAARDAMAQAGEKGHEGHVTIQPLTIGYPRRGGRPVLPQERSGIAWHGDMDLLPHLAAIISGPPLEALVVWGDPLAFDRSSDRKIVTQAVESQIRTTYMEMLAGGMEPGAAHRSAVSCYHDEDKGLNTGSGDR